MPVTDGSMPEPTADGASAPAVSGPSAPSRKPGRRFLVAVLSCALGGAVGAGAYIVHKVGGADRTARTTVWQKPDGEPDKDPAGDVSAGRASTELSKLQLPVPAGYTLGPDSGSDGNDSEISGKKAAAALKETGRAWPASSAGNSTGASTSSRSRAWPCVRTVRTATIWPSKSRSRR